MKRVTFEGTTYIIMSTVARSKKSGGPPMFLRNIASFSTETETLLTRNTEIWANCTSEWDTVYLKKQNTKYSRQRVVRKQNYIFW